MKLSELPSSEKYPRLKPTPAEARRGCIQNVILLGILATALSCFAAQYILPSFQSK